MDNSTPTWENPGPNACWCPRCNEGRIAGVNRARPRLGKAGPPYLISECEFYNACSKCGAELVDAMRRDVQPLTSVLGTSAAMQPLADAIQRIAEGVTYDDFEAEKKRVSFWRRFRAMFRRPEKARKPAPTAPRNKGRRIDDDVTIDEVDEFLDSHCLLCARHGDPEHAHGGCTLNMREWEDAICDAQGDWRRNAEGKLTCARFEFDRATLEGQAREVLDFVQTQGDENV